MENYYAGYTTSMTLDEAKQVLAKMDRESTARFTPEEREALTVIGVAWKMGEITDEQAADLTGMSLDVFRPN